ncbi:MAG: prolipoprotein diacylglyceryl transferase [Puniceicoccaceae bacterium]
MKPVLAYWVHDLEPVIIEFTDKIAVRWYGVAYVAGFLIAMGLLNLYWRKGRSPIAPRSQENLVFALILGVMIGGRIGYFLFYDFGSLARNPLVLFQVWEGGMASHGGFLGVAIAAFWMARRMKLPFLQLWDYCATMVPAGLMLGRIANFINGELWGKVTDVPWAVIFPDSDPLVPVELIAPRHPSQLYAAVLEGLIPLIYIQWRFWKVTGRWTLDSGKKPKVQRPGSSVQGPRYGHLAGEFLILYSLGRMIGEVFREPDAELILSISRGTFYSIFLMLAGIGLILWTRSLTNAQSR